MKITVKVIPGASKDSVEEIGLNQFKVKTTKKAINGQANEAVIQLLAGYFKIKPNQIEILRGETSRQKVVEMEKL